MKIVVLDGYTVNPGDNPWDELSLCGELVVYDRSVPSEVLERAHDADILVTNKTPLDRSLLEQLPRLKFIAMLATGYNVVDAEFARERNIPVANIPAYGTDTVAQFVMALVLELCHGVGQHARSVARGKWTTCQDWSYWKRPQIELRDLALGIVGFGRIGQRVAELGHAFGMNIFYSSRSPKQTTHLPVTYMSVEDLFDRADIISLHCSLSPANAGMVNRTLLQRMKPTAYLINTARGQLIHEQDLADALQAGTLAGAALDVLSSEPPPADHPLLHAPNCLVTPHMAWASLSARQRILKGTVENVRAFLSGKPIHVVNPPSIAAR